MLGVDEFSMPDANYSIINRLAEVFGIDSLYDLIDKLQTDQTTITKWLSIYSTKLSDYPAGFISALNHCNVRAEYIINGEEPIYIDFTDTNDVNKDDDQQDITSSDPDKIFDQVYGRLVHPNYSFLMKLYTLYKNSHPDLGIYDEVKLLQQMFSSQLETAEDLKSEFFPTLAKCIVDGVLTPIMIFYLSELKNSNGKHIAFEPLFDPNVSVDDINDPKYEVDDPKNPFIFIKYRKIHSLLCQITGGNTLVSIAHELGYQDDYEYVDKLMNYDPPKVDIVIEQYLKNAKCSINDNDEWVMTVKPKPVVKEKIELPLEIPILTDDESVNEIKISEEKHVEDVLNDVLDTQNENDETKLEESKTEIKTKDKDKNKEVKINKPKNTEDDKISEHEQPVYSEKGHVTVAPPTQEAINKKYFEDQPNMDFEKIIRLFNHVKAYFGELINEDRWTTILGLVRQNIVKFSYRSNLKLVERFIMVHCYRRLYDLATMPELYKTRIHFDKADEQIAILITIFHYLVILPHTQNNPLCKYSKLMLYFETAKSKVLESNPDYYPHIHKYDIGDFVSFENMESFIQKHISVLSAVSTVKVFHERLIIKARVSIKNSKTNTVLPDEPEKSTRRIVQRLSDYTVDELMAELKDRLPEGACIMIPLMQKEKS